MGKILVTGADGFIGSHLTEALIERGYEVKAMTFYNSFSSWGWLDGSDFLKNKNCEIISGDIRDSDFVRHSVKGCNTILHLAALIAIPYSYLSPRSYVETNILGTLNILQAARDQAVDRLIHTSTSEVYGTAKFVPITEDHPINGQSPYAASKIGADQLAMSFYSSFDMPVGIIRPFNTYGPRQSSRAVIPTIITQLLSGCKSISLGSLTPTRDFNYVEDTVNGFISAIESERFIGEVINIGSNFEISIGETVQLIAKIMGVNVEIKTDSKRIRPDKSEVERLYSDNQKAKNLLNWSPIYGGIDGMSKGLIKTIDWFSDPKNTSSYKSGIYNT